MKEKEQKMQGKDYISCGILSLLCIVGMLIAAIMNISGYTAAFYASAASFFIGILYVITVCKVPKKGAVIVFSIVPCAYFFTSGAIEGIIGSAGIAVFAVIAEWILSKNRKSMKRITISCVIYTLYMSVIGMIEPFVFTDDYCGNALEHGINPTVVENMREMYDLKYMWLVVIAATLLMTLLGVAVGKGIMKKHLKKAGVI